MINLNDVTCEIQKKSFHLQMPSLTFHKLQLTFLYGRMFFGIEQEIFRVNTSLVVNNSVQFHSCECFNFAAPQTDLDFFTI